MKFFLRFILPTVLIIFCSFCIIFFRPHVQGQIWKGYKVLSVDASISEATVLTLLQNAGIEKVISKSSVQYNPLDTDRPLVKEVLYAPVQPMTESYSNLFEPFFYDLTSKFNLYYLADSPLLVSNVEKAFKTIQEPWSLEKIQSYNFLSWIICAVFFLFLIRYAHKKILYIIVMLPFMLLTYANPVLSSTVSFCFMALAVLFIERIWLRPGWGQALLHNVFFLSLAGGSVLVNILSGWLTSVFFLVAVIASVAFFFLIYQCVVAVRNTRKYNPVPIIDARSAFFKKKQVNLFLKICTGTIFLLGVFFIVASFFYTSINDLSIPAPTGYTAGGFSTQAWKNHQNSAKQKKLPDFWNTINYCWQTVSFPFKTLHDPNIIHDQDEQVFISTYKLDEEGAVHSDKKLCLTFDNDFIRKTVASIEKNAVGIEKLLADQGGFVHVAYTSEFSRPISARPSFAFFIIVILSLCVPFIGILYIFFKVRT